MNTYILLQHAAEATNTISDSSVERVYTSKYYLLDKWKQETPIVYVWDKTLDEHYYHVVINGISINAESIDGLIAEAKSYDIDIRNIFEY